MNNHKNSGLPIVPLYYSVPLLAICIATLLILVFVFRIEVPGVYLQAPPNPIAACGELNQNDVYYSITSSLSFSSDNCLNVTGNNSIIDANSQYIITGSNAAGKAAVLVLGHNVTVMRLNISDADFGILVNSVNSTNITLNHINNSMSYSVYLNVSNNSDVVNNIFSYSGRDGVLAYLNINGLFQGNIIYGREGLPTPGTSAVGIELNNSRQNVVSNNSIFGFARSAALQYSMDNIFTGNIFNGPSFNGISLSINNGTTNYFNQDKIISSQKSAIFIDRTENVTLLNVGVFNTISPYYDIEAAAMPSGVQIFDTYLARYSFNSTLAVFRNTGNAWINFTRGLNGTYANLSADIRLAFNYVDVNSVQRPELNKSAIITFQGLSSTISNPAIYRNGQLCPSSVCVNLTSLNGATVVFNVTGWTNYSINNGPALGPYLDINEPDSNEVYSQSSFPVVFDVDLSQPGKAWFSLNNGSTNNSMNSDDNVSFIYSQSAMSAGNYTFTTYANFTGTTQKATDFVNFKVTDTTGPGITPTVTIDEPDVNEVYYPVNFPVTFVVDLSQPGKAWFSLNNGVTNVTMSNSSSSNTRFTYSQNSLNVGNYTLSAYANFTGTTQRDTTSVNFRVGSGNVNQPNTTIILNNTNSTNLPGESSPVEFKYVAYWLVVAVLSIAVIILILLIIKYFKMREVATNTIPSSIVSQLR